jgi:hypothetical protein
MASWWCGRQRQPSLASQINYWWVGRVKTDDDVRVLLRGVLSQLPTVLVNAGENSIPHGLASMPQLASCPF